MDVDTDRITDDELGDGELMEYEEEVASEKDEDGDEVMDDGEADEEDMEPESIIPVSHASTIEPSFFPPIATLPTASLSHDLPLASPPVSIAPETEMTPADEQPPKLEAHPEPTSYDAPPFIVDPETDPPSTTIPFPPKSSPTIQLPLIAITEETETKFMPSNDHPEAEESKGEGRPALEEQPPKVVEKGVKAEEGGAEAEETDVALDEDEYYEDGDSEDHSLPPIILHLPSLGARSLFFTLNDQDHQLELPIWLEGKEEELAEATLADVWTALKDQMTKDGLVKNGEMVITEKQMSLRMGEDDVNLQSITFLELIRLHQECDLPEPVQLYISFEPNRFITRFIAIRKELEIQAAQDADGSSDEHTAKEAVVHVDGEPSNAEGDEGDGGEHEDEYEEGDGEAQEEYDVEEDQVEDDGQPIADEQATDTANAEVEEPVRHNPSSDKVRTLLTEPLAIASSARLMANPKGDKDVRPDPVESTIKDQPVEEERSEVDPENYGGEQEDEEPIEDDITQLSQNSQAANMSQLPEKAPSVDVVPKDEVEMFRSAGELLSEDPAERIIDAAPAEEKGPPGDLPPPVAFVPLDDKGLADATKPRMSVTAVAASLQPVSSFVESPAQSSVQLPTSIPEKISGEGDSQESDDGVNGIITWSENEADASLRSLDAVHPHQVEATLGNEITPVASLAAGVEKEGSIADITSFETIDEMAENTADRSPSPTISGASVDDGIGYEEGKEIVDDSEVQEEEEFDILSPEASVKRPRTEEDDTGVSTTDTFLSLDSRSKKLRSDSE
ncbi:hypothetical protein P7C73_g348, partial [Tremellales sp. Uapishka_1]